MRAGSSPAGGAKVAQSGSCSSLVRKRSLVQFQSLAPYIEKVMDYTPTIKKENLKHGHYYRGRCRNAEFARWNANEECFYHWRYKFGDTFIETIKCPEDDNVYDVFVVWGEIINPDIEIPFRH